MGKVWCDRRLVGGVGWGRVGMGRLGRVWWLNLYDPFRALGRPEGERDPFKSSIVKVLIKTFDSI